MAANLEGYWEIVDVKKDGKLIKSYSMNMNIDYFDVNEDWTGFRKKVSPSLDGSFEITDHVSWFKLEPGPKGLIIQYNNGDVNYKETITKAESNLLIIKNPEGFIYTYKNFEGIELDEE